MELSATAKVILGMLAARPRSGYEIKQLVDNSTRIFWAASYGQIYPELKRLERAGLVSGTDASHGGRQRRVYDLTSGAITAGAGAPEAAVQALAAGTDMVQVDDPAQAIAVRDAVLAAAKSGAIPRERLDEAVGRQLELKRKLGLGK